MCNGRPAAAIKVAALVSGGKDSVLAAHVAQSHGWDVTHVVTVRPRVSDSYMFHAANTHLGALIAEAMGTPHVLVETAGEKERELADLEAALARLPIDGFTSGALASEYQRTRLEGVGHRLGLKTFAPLWHKDPRSYLHGLLESTWDIRFSRTAADGVPTAWAGQRLDAAKVDAMLAHRARPHVAGEGGEYETLVLDAPHYARRLVVEKARVEATASRATWVVSAWRTEPK